MGQHLHNETCAVPSLGLVPSLVLDSDHRPNWQLRKSLSVLRPHLLLPGIFLGQGELPLLLNILRSKYTYLLTYLLGHEPLLAGPVGAWIGWQMVSQLVKNLACFNGKLTIVL